MQITVKLFASFQTGRFQCDVRSYPESTLVSHILQELAIPESEVGIILLNMIHAKSDQSLAEGDILAIFPLVGGG